MPVPAVPVVQTENDKQTAAEAEFIAQFETKGGTVSIPAAKKEETPVVGDPAPTPEPAVAADGVPPVTETTPAAEGVKQDDPEPATPPEPDEEVVEVTDEAFQAAMAAERAPLSLDAIPEEARPIVQKKMKDLEAGFTRTMQKLGAERKEIAAVKAERRFQEERPDDYIVTLLLSQPDLMARVNRKLDEIEGSPAAREAHGIVVERAREKALADEEKELEREKRDLKRATEIVTMGRAAAKAAGVPFEMGVEADIAAYLKINGEITETEIRSIASEKARIWKAELRKNERLGRDKYVAEKVTDRRKAGLAVRPSTGATPAPTPAPVARNDDEFIAQFVGRG